MTLADDLVKYDASALAEAIRNRSLSAADVVEACYARIERLNGAVNAIVTLDKERALARARAADLALARGEAVGPLHGVPVTVKDALHTAGLRTTAGHERLRDFVPERDAAAIDRIQGAGAIVIGKTNCSTLCGDLQTSNPIFGTTNNPWENTRTSGGSSGGEAAAVALGLSALGIGTDTGGSIRVPASYCGVYGFKPSLRKVPSDAPAFPLDAAPRREDHLTVIGPIARSVRDLMLCYDVLSGESCSAAASAPPPRVAWTHEFAFPIDDAVTAELERAFDALRGSAARVEKVASPFDLWKTNLSYFMLNMYEFKTKETDAAFYRLFWMFEWMRSAFRGGLDGSYARLKAEQRELSGRFESFIEAYDCWVVPATPSVAIRHQKTGRSVPMTVNGKEKKVEYWNAVGGFAFFVNLLGNPSVVIPVGRSKDGLPVGVQVVGKHGQDASLLRAAGFIADAIGQLRTA